MATASPVTVKRLQDGLLFVSTDYVSGNIGLDWNQVKSVQSTAIYRIVLTNGKRLEGKIEKYSIDSPTTQDFSIREATEETQVPSLQIVSIDSRSPTFWRQLQGDIDFGYSFTGGNSQSTLNSDTSAAYKTPRWEVATSFDSTFSGQPGSSETNRQDFQGTFSKFLTLTIKLRNNFHLAFTFWDNFDSRPPLTARKNELGTSIGIGWSF
jgi:hypothetical protein